MKPLPVAPAVAFVWSLAACSSAPLRVDAPDPLAVPSLTAAEFPGLARVALGFDARAADASWIGGDKVVFALRLKKGDEVHRWLLQLSSLFTQGVAERLMKVDGSSIGMWEQRTWNYTVTDHGEHRDLTAKSLMLPVMVRISDETGKPLADSIVKLPTDLLARGVLPAIDKAVAPAHRAGPADAAFDETEIRPMVDATIAMMALLNVVQEDEALAGYFWQVVEKPSLWSMITGLGVHATLTMPFEQSVALAVIPPHLPTADRAYIVPVHIDVNGSPALLVDLVTIDAARPFAVCGGMIAATARHPTRPDVTFEVQIVSARCGKP